jgi:aryl-alcohol dehydrogenase-like predicted oxidoreductase
MPKSAENAISEYRVLGSTGERVSPIGIGGWHLGLPNVDEPLSLRIVRTAIDRGVNFMDNSWDYNGGASEIRLGKALRDGYRDKVFLMTKIDGRSKREATRQLDESLRRLQTDHIDLVQHHEVIRFEDPHRIFDAEGANAALADARAAGKIRYIGFTGHKDPAVHLRMFETARKHNFHFDTVQMPINVMDAHFRSFTHQVMPVALQQGIGVLAMKTFGGNYILQSNTVQPSEALHYGLTQPVSVVITGIDEPRILDQAFAAVRNFKPLTQPQIASLLERTRSAAMQGKYELFKTTTNFDGTAANPQWLG